MDVSMGARRRTFEEAFQRPNMRVMPERTNDFGPIIPYEAIDDQYYDDL